LAIGQTLEVGDDCFNQFCLVPRECLTECGVADLQGDQQRFATAAGVNRLATPNVAFDRLIVVIRKHVRSKLRGVNFWQQWYNPADKMDTPKAIACKPKKNSIARFRPCMPFGSGREPDWPNNS
jgi:hypothetical protein